MKTSISYSLLAAALACGLAQGQTTAYTTPVGYVSTPMPAGQFTFGGLSVQNPVVTAGVLTASTSNSVSASSINFTTVLTAGVVYMLELADGTVQEITSWTGSTLTTPENISSFVTNGVTTFKLRASATVSSVFGANNSAGLTALTASSTGDSTSVDNVVIYTSPGNSVSIYYYDDNGNGILDAAGGDGWYTAGGLPADNQPMPYPDGFLIQRVSGSLKTLVVSGEVKTTPTKSMLGGGFNFLSSISPVGLTLLTSGLQNGLTNFTDLTTGDSTTVDNVVLTIAGIQTNTYYYDGNGNGTLDLGDGWYTAGGLPADDAPLDGGFYLVNVAGPKPYKISVPANYSSL